MYTFEETLTAPANAAKIWELYSDVSRWPDWNEAINSVELDGPFESGSTGSIQVLIAPPLGFSLENVEAGEGFDIVAGLGDLKVTMKQQLSDDGDGECTLKHALIMEGANEAMLQTIGEMLSANIPDSMQRLMELAA